MKRLWISFAIALLLPFPGPHLDRYTPVIETLFGSSGAPAGFFVLAAVLIAIYTGVVWGLSWVVVRRKRDGGQQSGLRRP